VVDLHEGGGVSKPQPIFVYMKNHYMDRNWHRTALPTVQHCRQQNDSTALA
jgi:hypothetical protein